MGQVSSSLLDYFSNRSENKPFEQDKEESHVSFLNTRRSFRLRGQGETTDNGISNNENTYLSYLKEVNPRMPLKRSRSFCQTTSLPDTFKDLFSPNKKIKFNDDQYLDFPFLCDEDTIQYYRNSKIFVILRGLPGSGKSVIAKAIKFKYIISEICSTDDFFMKDGVYVYDQKLVSEAHRHSQQNAIEAVLQRTPIIIIDNSNLMLWEMDMYLNLAKAYGYLSIIIEPNTPWKRDPAVLAIKNHNEFDEKTITQKLSFMEEIKPLYYGWFLSDTDSDLLKKEAQSWLIKAYNSSHIFKDEFTAISGHNNIKDFLKFFKKPGIELALHCTAKYLGKILSDENSEYVENAKRFIGKMFDIEIVGFVITPRTFGARVRLSAHQLNLWAMDDSEAVPEEFFEWSLPVHSETVNGSDDNSAVGHFNSTNENGDSSHFEGFTNGENASLDLIEDSFALNSAAILEKDLKSISNVSSDSFNNLFSHNATNLTETNEIQLDNSLDVISEDVITAETLYNGSNQKDCSNKDQSACNQDSNLKKKPRKKFFKSLPVPDNLAPIEESISRATLSLVYEYNDKEFPEQFAPTFGKGSRAHFTLGCAPDVHARSTGLDLMMAIEKEKNDSCKFNVEFDDGSARSYGNGLWVFYPNATLKFSAVFNAWV